MSPKRRRMTKFILSFFYPLGKCILTNKPCVNPGSVKNQPIIVLTYSYLKNNVGIAVSLSQLLQYNVATFLLIFEWYFFLDISS